MTDGDRFLVTFVTQNPPRWRRQWVRRRKDPPLIGATEDGHVGPITLHSVEQGRNEAGRCVRSLGVRILRTPSAPADRSPSLDDPLHAAARRRHGASPSGVGRSSSTVELSHAAMAARTGRPRGQPRARVSTLSRASGSTHRRIGASAHRRGIEHYFIEPSKPVQDALVESFNRTCRLIFSTKSTRVHRSSGRP